MESVNTLGSEQPAKTAPSVARAFAIGLKEEFQNHAANGAERPVVVDEKIHDLMDEIKSHVLTLFGLDRPNYEEPHGLRFVGLRFREGVDVRPEQIVAALREHPHLDNDHFLRIARDPDSDGWLMCVQPRSRSTDCGIEYWLRNDSLKQDRLALKAICLDLHETPHDLRVWMSTEPLNPTQQSEVRGILRELQEELPEYNRGKNRLDVRAPLEIQPYLPPLIRLKEDYVVLGPIVDPVPREQEDRELEDIRARLDRIKKTPSETHRRLTVMIYRHALTIRIINALNRFRAEPENARFLHITGRPEIREQYPQLFAPLDTRRKIERVSLDELPAPLPKRERPARKDSWWVAPQEAEQEQREAPAAATGAHRRVDPDLIRAVKEVRRAEREERKGKSWGKWLSGWMRRRR